MWRFFACGSPKVKFPAFAGIATMSQMYYLHEKEAERRTNEPTKVKLHQKSTSIDLKKVL